MTVFEYAGRLLIVDCGVLFPEPDQPGVDLILPDFSSIEDRLGDIEAIVLTHAHEDHIGAVPYLLRERKPTSRWSARSSPWRWSRQADRAPHRPGHRRGGGRHQAAVRAVRPANSSRSTTPSPTRSRSAIRTPRRPGAAHRRLQDGPAAAGRPADRPAAASPGSAPTGVDLLMSDSTNAEVPGIVTSERDDRARCSPRSSPPPSSGSSWPASPATCTGCSRCSTPRRAHGRKVALRRPVDGAQHGRRPRSRLPACRSARRA